MICTNVLYLNLFFVVGITNRSLYLFCNHIWQFRTVFSCMSLCNLKLVGWIVYHILPVTTYKNLLDFAWLNRFLYFWLKVENFCQQVLKLLGSSRKVFTVLLEPLLVRYCFFFATVQHIFNLLHYVMRWSHLCVINTNKLPKRGIFWNYSSCACQ